MSRVLLISKPNLCNPQVVNELRQACGRSLANEIDSKKLPLDSTRALASVLNNLLGVPIDRHLVYTFAIHLSVASAGLIDKISPVVCDFDSNSFVAIATGSIIDWHTFVRNASESNAEDLQQVAQEILEHFDGLQTSQVPIGKISFRN